MLDRVVNLFQLIEPPIISKLLINIKNYKRQLVNQMSTFDIRGLPDTQRYQFWQEAICETYLTVDCQLLGDAPLEGVIDAYPFGDLELSQVYTPAMNYVRGDRELKRSDEEYFQLILAVEGDVIIEQREIQSRIKPGEMVIYSSTERSKCICPNGAYTRVIKIPRTLLEDRMGRVDQISATVLHSTTPLGMLARNLIPNCLETAHSTNDVDNRTSNGVLDILTSAIEASLPSASTPKQSHALLKVKKHIEQCFADPELDVLRIAEFNNMSVRTLNRLFAAEGTTTMRWVWTRRLAHSHKMLSEGRASQVSQVAFDCGFNDLSHFSKVFKNRYGVTPQKILRNQR